MCIFQRSSHSMKAENLITEEQEKKNWEAGRKALEEHYRRAEVSATAELADKKGWYRSHLTISGEPMISVIIPSKDHINDLELCISSIEIRQHGRITRSLLLRTTVWKKKPLYTMRH